MTAEAPPQREGETRFLLASFSLGHMANDWAPGAVWLIAPAIAFDLGLSPSELGLLITISAIGASLAYFPAGLLADHVAHRGRLLALTFWWVAIGFFAASFATSFWSIAILLALAGLGDAAWHPIATGVLAKRWPARRGEALGVHAIGGSLAVVLAPLAVGYLLAVLDWREALRISVLPALIMALVFTVFIARRVPPSDDSGTTRGDVGAFFAVWLRPLGLAFLTMVVAYHMSFTAVMSMTPLYLQTTHGYSPAQAGTLFAVGLLAGTVVLPWLGRVSDRIGRKRVVVVMTFFGGLLAAGIAFAGPGPALLLTVVGAIGMLVGVRAVILALAVDFAAKREGTTLGFVFGLMDGVGALGAVLAGLVGEVDLSRAFLLGGGLALASALLALLLPLRRASG
ncbi:MAG TPA: MFS transporter [Alphaproteobacteria bacterium]|jgi:MFS family permease|nr:MFS transporter [Alphaproteobacteria bacterium]MDP6269770.1 MFS transporter [Alphaproteobacteria bacterium]MDP7428976.1 MFS transporter [Alphaproteobacteria bacterium]HJM51561.1 MFS transporter [Alphaproteobacteria bacterium]